MNVRDVVVPAYGGAIADGLLNVAAITAGEDHSVAWK